MHWSEARSDLSWPSPIQYKSWKRQAPADFFFNNTKGLLFLETYVIPNSANLGLRQKKTEFERLNDTLIFDVLTNKIACEFSKYIPCHI